VDEPLEDPQSQVLSGVEVPGLPQVFDHMIVHVVGIEDSATCVRPANENVQERFDYKLMNEPYLLRKTQEGKKRQTQNRRKGKKKTTRKEIVQTRGDLVSDPTCRLTSFHALKV